MAKSNNERFNAYYQRKKEGIENPKCKCDRLLKGSLSKKRQLCKTCYDASPDKRHKVWLDVNKRRDRQVLAESLQEWGGYKVGGTVQTPDGSTGAVQAIASYIDGSINATVTFADGDTDSFLLTLEKPLIVY